MQIVVHLSKGLVLGKFLLLIQDFFVTELMLARIFLPAVLTNRNVCFSDALTIIVWRDRSQWS